MLAARRAAAMEQRSDVGSSVEEAGRGSPAGGRWADAAENDAPHAPTSPSAPSVLDPGSWRRLDSLEFLESRVDALAAQVARLEAIESARSGINMLITWLDAAHADPEGLLTHGAAEAMLTPSVVVEMACGSRAESLAEVLPMLRAVAGRSDHARRTSYVTNVSAELCRDDDPNIIKASGYLLVVSPAPSPSPAVVLKQTMNARMVKGFDGVWRINSLRFTDVHGPT
ncbi:hypothetical protein FOA52_001485 [Chlamydomonas sp. UWO 241]|nr:hypothetical protein FOA52_001485 [Chlamydomonas sp. UWO 241]